MCCVPQGSVLGPKEFVVYTEDIVETVDKFAVNHHLYADDSSSSPTYARKQLRNIVVDLSYVLNTLGTGGHRDGCNLIQTKQS